MSIAELKRRADNTVFARLGVTGGFYLPPTGGEVPCRVTEPRNEAVTRPGDDAFTQYVEQSLTSIIARREVPSVAIGAFIRIDSSRYEIAEILTEQSTDIFTKVVVALDNG